MEKDGRKSIVTILFIIVLILLGITTYLVYTKFSDLGSCNNVNYRIRYVRNWEVDKKSKDKITFKHQSESKMSLEVRLLNENEIKSNEEIQNAFLDYINKETGYILVSKDETTNTKNNYEGYTYLFENGEDNILYIVGYKYNKVFLFRYESNIMNFDTLLDSVLNTAYYLEIKGSV